MSWRSCRARFVNQDFQKDLTSPWTTLMRVQTSSNAGETSLWGGGSRNRGYQLVGVLISMFKSRAVLTRLEVVPSSYSWVTFITSLMINHSHTTLGSRTPGYSNTRPSCLKENCKSSTVWQQRLRKPQPLSKFQIVIFTYRPSRK